MINSDVNKQPILEVRALSKYFINDDNNIKMGLENIDLSLHEGEIIAILGRSGSGKSTLLRMLSGLIKPSEGGVFYREEHVVGPVSSTKMVFQNYALLPWMSVSENIAFGLSASNMHPKQKQKRVEQVIQLIGLQGFQSAYPGELSGGMCQRVGFARALVTQPEVLLLDEPFSALDALTARQLRKNFMQIWRNNIDVTKSVVLVTHDVSEAVEMADRIIILAANPGRIFCEIDVKGKQPVALIEEIYAVLEDAEEAA